MNEKMRLKGFRKGIGAINTFFLKLGNNKVEHVGNYVLLLALDEYEKAERANGIPAHFVNMTALKLDKLMYFVEGFSYLRLGYGMTEEIFSLSEYGVISHKIRNKWRHRGQNNMLWGIKVTRDYDKSFKMPIFLLTDEEKKVIQEVYELFRDISVWDMIPLIKSQTPYLKAVERSQNDENAYAFVENGDIKEFFLSLEELGSELHIETITN